MWLDALQINNPKNINLEKSKQRIWKYLLGPCEKSKYAEMEYLACDRRVTRTGPDGQGTHLHGHSITHTAHQPTTLDRVLLRTQPKAQLG